MMKWSVEICRTYDGFGKIEVDAETENEAIAKALEQAGTIGYRLQKSDFDDEIVSCSKVNFEDKTLQERITPSTRRT